MEARPASLTIRSPAGEHVSEVDLTEVRVGIGRPVPGSRPDVALEPDPERWVSRLHCIIEQDGSGWWVTDNGTPNGTFIRRGDLGKLQGRTRLVDGDVICILGNVSRGGPAYWELSFSDPFSTRRPSTAATTSGVCVEYDWIQAKLFRRDGSRRIEIDDLPPKAHQLVRFLVHRSQENDNSPVACTHDELIAAVWGDPSEWAPYRSYTRENLRDLVSDLRQRIEPDPGHPMVLEAVPGLGYRLNICRAT